MNKLFSKIFETIFKNQNMTNKKRIVKLNKILSGNSAGRKICANSAATLTINNSYKQEKCANEEKIEAILKKYTNNPEKLFDYIKGAGTDVIKNKSAGKILPYFNEKEGFILPQEGTKAILLNLIFNKKLSAKTKEMFIVSSFKVNECAMTYQFYNWYCYKMKLTGFEDETQKKFKHVFEICETSKIDELSFEEILELKGAIKRDIEAIDFVKRVAQKQSLSKKNLENIRHGKTVNV